MDVPTETGCGSGLLRFAAARGRRLGQRRVRGRLNWRFGRPGVERASVNLATNTATPGAFTIPAVGTGNAVFYRIRSQ